MKEHIAILLAYLDENDGIRYLQFGKQYAAWQKHQELLLKGKTVSPVFLKTLYYTANDFQTIQAKRREFVACMQDKMNKGEYIGMCTPQEFRQIFYTKNNSLLFIPNASLQRSSFYYIAIYQRAENFFVPMTETL